MADYWDSWDSNPANAKDCPTCGGSGETRTKWGTIFIANICEDCGGSGEVSPIQWQLIMNDNFEDDYEKDND